MTLLLAEKLLADVGGTLHRQMFGDPAQAHGGFRADGMGDGNFARIASRQRRQVFRVQTRLL